MPAGACLLVRTADYIDEARLLEDAPRDRPNSRYQLAGLRHISGHEYGQCDLEAFEHALVKVGELGRALD